MQTTYLSAAETAKLLRQALKANFPGVKFSVRSSTYSMGASIRVSYTDGPKLREVEAVADRFAGADFDGMVDLRTSREATLLAGPDGALRQVRFGADYVFVDRHYTPGAYRAAGAKVAAFWGLPAELVEDSNLYVYSGHASGLRNDPYVSGNGTLTLAQEIRRELEARPED